MNWLVLLLHRILDSISVWKEANRLEDRHPSSFSLSLSLSSIIVCLRSWNSWIRGIVKTWRERKRALFCVWIGGRRRRVSDWEHHHHCYLTLFPHSLRRLVMVYLKPWLVVVESYTSLQQHRRGEKPLTKDISVWRDATRSCVRDQRYVSRRLHCKPQRNQTKPSFFDKKNYTSLSPQWASSYTQADLFRTTRRVDKPTTFLSLYKR